MTRSHPTLFASSSSSSLSSASASALAFAFVFAIAPSAADAAADLPVTRTWVFQARLDGKPIGEHRFVVVDDGGRRTVTSDARFDVKLLGFTVYRYVFHAAERWSGDCLQSLAADTDDDGTPARVRAEREGERLRIRGGTADVDAAGCVMTYAYWNPALRAQTRLLNPQTGRVDAVTITAAAPGSIEVGARRIDAQRFRIAAPPGPVDVWTTPDGEWVGLDAGVKGGRTLSYRLREKPAVSAASRGSPAPSPPS